MSTFLFCCCWQSVTIRICHVPSPAHCNTSDYTSWMDAPWRTTMQQDLFQILLYSSLLLYSYMIFIHLLVVWVPKGMYSHMNFYTFGGSLGPRTYLLGNLEILGAERAQSCTWRSVGKGYLDLMRAYEVDHAFSSSFYWNHLDHACAWHDCANPALITPPTLSSEIQNARCHWWSVTWKLTDP